MSNSGCSQTGCEEPDDEEYTWRVTSLLWFYVIGWVYVVGWILAASILSWMFTCRSDRECKRWLCSTLKILFLSGTWPIWFSIILIAMVPFACRMGHVKTRDAKRLLQYKLQYADEERWPQRGWLTMLRARHRRFLARPAKGWMAMFTKPNGGRPAWKTRKLPPASPEVAFYNYVGFLAESACFISPNQTSSMELLEEGQSDEGFMWAVETVVELQEEGLFRHIVTYL